MVSSLSQLEEYGRLAELKAFIRLVTNIIEATFIDGLYFGGIGLSDDVPTKANNIWNNSCRAQDDYSS